MADLRGVSRALEYRRVLFANGWSHYSLPALSKGGEDGADWMFSWFGSGIDGCHYCSGNTAGAKPLAQGTPASSEEEYRPAIAILQAVSAESQCGIPGFVVRGKVTVTLRPARL